MLKIVIETDADFTPPGKRTARVVQTDRGGRQLRFYVSGRIYRAMPPTDENLKLAQRWIDRR